MSFKEIKIENEVMNPFHKIGKEWFLLTAGDEQGYNMMTASWGLMGIMWGKNAALSVVRPQRFTKKYLDDKEYFTMCFFGDKQREELNFCGTKSGWDCDKMKESSLTPKFIDNTVGFEEAELILVCKKVYVDEVREENFLDMLIPKSAYKNKDYHIVYIGEIVKAYKKED